MGSSFKQFNISACIILFFIFIYLLHGNDAYDNMDKKQLNTIICHKEVDLPDIDITDRLVIESVIEKYNKKRAMNKSNRARILESIKSGIIRGVIGGAIVGKGFEGAASGAVVFGAISGISTAYSLIYDRSSFLNEKKHT
jgi:hypothetical protein